MSAPSLLPDPAPIRLGLACKCPKCGKGAIFKAGLLTMAMNDRCPSCNLNFADNDIGDGPAVFMIFILGFLLAPLALLVEKIFGPPLWLHAVLWTIIALGMTLGALKPLKAYIIALQYKHRPGDWE